MSNNISDSFDQLTQEALSVSELDRCYATLGLNNSASIEQVKERCKELIKQWHPDQFKDDPARHQVAVEKFAAFKKAYDTISSIENSPNAAAASSASSEQPRTKQPAEEPKQLSVNSVNESVYAEFWRRVVARLLDFLIIVLPSSLIIVLGNKSAGAEALATLVFMAYCVVMESSEKQATLGKMAVGIKVVDVQGNRLSIGRAVGRHLGNLLNALTFGIGYAVAAFSKRGQALHDMVSGCYVVHKAATPSEVVFCATKPRLSAASILLLIFIALPVPLGILAAIAIPQFTAYKKKAEQTSAKESTSLLKQQIPTNNDNNIERESLNSKKWTQESTGSTEIGPWLYFSDPGTQYCRDSNRIIHRVYPPGIKPSASKADPDCVWESTELPGLFNNFENWTQESTGSTENGPWLNYSDPGTLYCRDSNRIIYRIYPPGLKPDAAKADPNCARNSASIIPK